MSEGKLKALIPADKIIIDDYLKNWNQTKAYQKAHPKVRDTVARVLASRLFANDNFQAHIKVRLAESQMSADEALQRMADMARADVAKFIDADLNGWDVNLFQVVDGQVVAKPETKFVKKLRKKETTDKFGAVTVTTEIEMYSAQDALDKILRVWGKYQDNLELRLPEKLTVRLIKDDDGN